MRKRYEDLQQVLAREEGRIAVRAINETISMMKEMGIVSGEELLLEKSDKLHSVFYNMVSFRRHSDTVGENELIANYYCCDVDPTQICPCEIENVNIATEVHYEVRRKYNRYIKEQRSIEKNTKS